MSLGPQEILESVFCWTWESDLLQRAYLHSVLRARPVSARCSAHQACSWSARKQSAFWQGLSYPPSHPLHTLCCFWCHLHLPGGRREQGMGNHYIHPPRSVTKSLQICPDYSLQGSCSLLRCACLDKEPQRISVSLIGKSSRLSSTSC